ncbi:hypothetical protein EHI8A_050230 [Entamoeba histolytica HM-1:IMSS-B]|uniref:Transmembrane protein n=6 Tax=Entamoeba histolytica TaxID=5759 RepID=C4M6M8_ENTH1|nr:hypothetical protein EHI_147520 [Entamoeba histolytica HM-1:IMSS]EMD47351.1 Hypothetical protein EHI5A_030920 [Entamoeba histolytica KU27]EMH76828.1 hypothetical protein EHI8A_050230 [Entamoeba histolytica HM-1:IMSS-B]EMS10967.1 hypothetical protein KM1_037210 [Entamoeba histolytica HM-3:IMSS]ENY61225.1 hypothetical protein EHI7A_014880 [Entamoeba histolytica HM-1:IMSS-A]GAT97142.1 hypothetical protein CL6EHI_147520 [Entamoeba histolytica]|eukprot:XP_654526.1 hypothetical protein EHI_147520 [Entamoeba histolytica HM-1:IMSS]
MKVQIAGLIYQFSIKKIHDIITLCIGIAFFLFSLHVTIFHVQYNSLPHVQSLTTIVTCSFLQAIIIILSSLIQILHSTHNIPTSMPFHYFMLFVRLLISLTNSIILIVSLHQFNKINDSSHHLSLIESQYSCCGWFSINTMTCKSLAAIRADRTCSSTIGVSFHNVLSIALVLNIVEIIVSLSHLFISYISHRIITQQDEETENPDDIISNYLTTNQTDINEETILLNNFSDKQHHVNRPLSIYNTTESDNDNDNSNLI